MKIFNNHPSPISFNSKVIPLSEDIIYLFAEFFLFPHNPLCSILFGYASSIKILPLICFSLAYFSFKIYLHKQEHFHTTYLFVLLPEATD